MPRFGFVGPSYASQSSIQNAEECYNFYVENSEVAGSESPRVHYPTPGLDDFATGSDLPSRGTCTTDGRTFHVSGAKFFEILSDGSITNVQDVSNDGLPAWLVFSSNGEVLVNSGKRCYVFQLATNTWVPLIPATFLQPNVVQVAHCDGYFFALFENSNQIQASNLLDATTWNPLSFTNVTVVPGNTVAIFVDHRELWIHGMTKSAVYVNSGVGGGSLGFPFVPLAGATIETGIAARASEVQLDNTIFWLGSDERGNGIGWKANGYTPARVTNHAVEFDIQNKVMSDAIAFSYQDQGHSFWQISFPTQNKTWVYDVSVGLWHRRAFWNIASGVFDEHLARTHTFNFGRHLVGSRSSNKIYDMSIEHLDDAGSLIRRLRRAPDVSAEGKYIYHSELQVYLESGLGPQPPLTGPNFCDAPVGVQSFVLQDPDGVNWTITVDDSGVLHSAVGGTNVATIILKDNDPIPTTAWLVGIDISGQLTTTAVPFFSSYPQAVFMATTGGNFPMNLTVNVAGLLQTTVPVHYRDPQIVLRWSDDGAKTWSNEYTRNCGRAGQYKKRVRWGVVGGLGRARNRVYEVFMTDPIPWRLVDAFLKAKGAQ